MECVICNHPKRKEIEQELLIRNFGDSDVTFKTIADTYNVPVKDLQIHALYHVAIEADNSIAEQIHLREADVIRDSMNENFATLKNLSTKINQIVSEHTSKEPTLNMLSKSVVDLYLGCSQAINEAANTLVKLNLAVNGEKDNGLDGLKALVNVINASKSPNENE